MITVQSGSRTPSANLKVTGPRRSSSPPKPHHPSASSSPAKKRRLEENAVVNRLQSRDSGLRAPPQGICAFCLMPAANPKDGPKVLISCFECGSSGHPYCLRWGRNLRKIKVVQSYEWRCIECKKCELCRDKGDDVSGTHHASKAGPCILTFCLSSRHNSCFVTVVTEAGTSIVSRLPWKSRREASGRVLHVISLKAIC